MKSGYASVDVYVCRTFLLLSHVYIAYVYTVVLFNRCLSGSIGYLMVLALKLQLHVFVARCLYSAMSLTRV